MGFIKLTLIVLALSYLWLKCIYYLIKENFDF